MRVGELVTDETAGEIAKTFIEAIAAPGYSEQALKILQAKKNLRLLEVGPGHDELVIKSISGGLLAQAKLAGPKRYLDRLEKLSPNILPQPKVHSLALRLTRVAHGALDAAIASPGSHDWDLAAADLLVHEAGGVMTDFNGQALRYNQPHTVHGALIAAGPPRHATLVDLVRDRQSEFA